MLIVLAITPLTHSLVLAMVDLALSLVLAVNTKYIHIQLFSVTITPISLIGPYDCGSGNIQIQRGSYGYGNLNNNQYLVTGYPQICVTYDYIPICRDGVSEEELRYLCYRSGYYGK